MSDFDLDTKNRWRSILPALGVDAKYLTNRQGPCPVCKGSTRFRFDDLDGRGTSYCNQCPEQRRSGGQLLMAVRGWDFPEMKAEVMKVVGIAQVQPERPAQDAARARKERNALWSAAHHDINAVDPVRQWWMRRVGEVPRCKDLRGADEIYHAPSGQRRPAMLALVRAPDNTPVQLHRTYLTVDGGKPLIEPTRLLMPKIVEGEMNGAAVRLSPPDGRLGIAEGIETAVAATILTGIPCWAAINAGNLEKWQPPKDVAVTIFADNDDSYTGEAAAYALAKRLRREGFEVSDQRPSMRGEDWNDVLLAARDAGVVLGKAA